MNVEELKKNAAKIRKLTLFALYSAQSGHPGPSLSIVEILTALLFFEMKLQGNKRDRIILSKGHAAASFYAALSVGGYIKQEELSHLREIGSSLQGHPVRNTLPLIDASTGSLGQGLSVGIGYALGIRIKSEDRRVYVIIGDGECQEGQIWEAAMSAAKFCLGNLIVVLDYNRFQNSGAVNDIMPIEPLREKWASFGWDAQEVDGHDLKAIISCFKNAHGKCTPQIIIAHTKKGKGVSFMEENMAWHSRVIKPSEYEAIIKELEENANG